MPPPRSSFPAGLQPVASDDVRQQRRTSRAQQLDFEHALRAGGTVVIKEGRDVNDLGADLSILSNDPSVSPSPSPAADMRTPRPVAQKPTTPTIVPPAPTPYSGPSSAKLSNPSPSPLNEQFYDAEGCDVQTKRRSMYRSPGTASSPDLATLVRKAKEKGNYVPANFPKEKYNDPPPPLPSPVTGIRLSSTRPRSSTSSAVHSQAPNLQPSTPLPNRPYPDRGIGSDWVFPSPSSRLAAAKGGGAEKPAKSSVRAKTSAFLGKMLGQSSIRDRSRTNSSASGCRSSPAFVDAFAPPVPPLPRNDVQRTPIASPVNDVFLSPRPSTAVSTSEDKPLPVIRGGALVDDEHESDDQSVVLVDSTPRMRRRTPSPDTRGMDKASGALGKLSGHQRQRSSSLNDLDLHRTSSSRPPSLPPKDNPEAAGGQGWESESSLNGILNDFRGVLSQLDPDSGSSYDLRDPSTPARRAYLRSKTALGDSVQDSSLNPSPRPRSAQAPDPIIPPRISSLNAPPNPRSGQLTSPKSTTALRHGPSPLRTRGSGTSVPSSYRDTNRLRVQHHSIASSSEPSLIPPPNEPRPHMHSSQQDLNTQDVPSRYASATSLATPQEETIDINETAKELAAKCWAENEEFLAKDKIAEWLGSHKQISKLALRHYMGYYDFTDLRLDQAFRKLCGKLYLKGETQQLDRILDEFSKRFWECNPSRLYGNASVVHAVSYSLLLLNTDLHIADVVSRMSRTQFQRNTMEAIKFSLQPVSSPSDNRDDSSAHFPEGSETTSASRSKRSGSITSWNSVSKDTLMSSAGASTVPSTMQPSLNSSTTSVQLSAGPDSKSASMSTLLMDKTWETDMEGLLKEMYNAVKIQQILQPSGAMLAARASTSSLSPGAAHAMGRNRSYRGAQDRFTTLKRGSIRGLQTIIGAPIPGQSPYSSNSSVDGRTSPSPSFATSLNENMQSSMAAFLTPSLGFASNLSHTIIRESREDEVHSLDSHESNSTTISISDEELALLGAPWAKEGILCRKQYWESTGKRAKSKNWMDVFVVIQKGDLSMFLFGEHGGGFSGVVGGGNWLDNAQSVGSVTLAHSLAHALPPPGYNRQRPHCMVLTLANGGVYFFQAGTEELVNEWVSTCNYWAARTSKEPLAGGVSNMEYGWNRVADPSTHGRSMTEADTSFDRTDTMSIRSTKSNKSKFTGWKEGPATVRAASSPWTDRTFINDWKPPMPPSVASTSDEETQLEALQKYVKTLKKELKDHNELRQPMMSLYAPRSANGAKSLANWEKKSQYLLTEIVKYDSYIDSLQSAMALRLKKRGEKALERALSGASHDDEALSNAKGKWKGRPEEDTILEADEPSISSQFHRREMAEGG